MKLSLRNRFLIPTLGLIVLGMSTTTVVSYIKSKDALTKSIISQVNQLGDSTNHIVTSWLEDRKREIRYWSDEKAYQTAVQDSFMGQAARKAANERLAELRKDCGYYETLNIASPKGELVAASIPEIVGKINVTDRAYFKEAMQGRLFISDVTQSRATGNPVFMISSPMKEGGQVAGVFFGVVDIARFTEMFINPVKIGKAGYAYIANGSGLIISHPDKSKIMKENIGSYDWGKKILSEGDGLTTYTYEGTEKLTAHRRNKELGWTVVVTAPSTEMFAPVKSLGYVNLIAAGSITLVAAVVILLLVRSIVNPLNRVIAGLGAASDEVAHGAGEMASSSQQLAEGSSQQAAALEETSSSLEEMTSMTKQNAGNASNAHSLMKEASQVVARADGSMRQLTVSMQEISQASEETSKIIKTIDEIAFQTNLLALNAAVEAARAGEAGAGFAVVADEVRTLAMRAAEAARSTAGLIDGTLKKVHTGSRLVNSTSEAFSEVAEASGRVNALVAEIAAASQEQAQGIEQVSKAVAEMDGVTQQTAAIAEESSSASQEMNAQAEQMKEFVGELAVLVKGSGKTVTERSSSPLESTGRVILKSTSNPPVRKALPHSSRTSGKDGGASEPAVSKAGVRQLSPEETIPFGDDGWKEF